MLPPHDWHAPIIRATIAAYSRSRLVNYIEIGIDRGHTLNAVAETASRVQAVDVTFEHVLNLPRNATRWEMTSDEFFKRYHDPADVIFIDGDHSAAQVAKDIGHAMRLLTYDGTVFVHDTFPQKQEWADSHCGDGWEAVRDLQAAGMQIATIPIFPGLSVITKYVEPVDG